MFDHKISIIIPCFCEEQALPFFDREITSIASEMKDWDFEFIYVDDGSSDNTLSILRQMALADSRVQYISFSRNFGKEAAMFAGLEASKGRYTVIMDVDLQDPPALLPQMVEFLQTNPDFDCIATRRVDRKGEPPIRSFFARCFYKIMRKMSKTEIVDGARDFRMMTRKMVNAILSMKEYNRFSKGIFSWVGFKTHWLEYENIQRVEGETKWSFWKLFIYSLDGITAFTTAPLAISSVTGITLCFMSFIAIIVIIIRHFAGINSAFGWASMVCIILMLSGIQLFSIGILGQYLAKTYLEVKNRPIYIAKETSEEFKSAPCISPSTNEDPQESQQ